VKGRPVKAIGAVIEGTAPLRLSKPHACRAARVELPRIPRPGVPPVGIEQDIAAGDAPPDAEVQMRCAAAAVLPDSPITVPSLTGH